MNFPKRFLGHFKTITKHRHRVICHCAKAGILWQGLRHDLSKYSPTEFIPGVRYYTGYRSPNEGEREDYGYSSAWLHHKGRNKHHYEYWIDYNLETKRNEPVEMPYRYLAEMFCDRVAASKIYNGAKYTDASPMGYYRKRTPHRSIHANTKKELETLLQMLIDCGEEQTFRYIKQQVKAAKAEVKAGRNIKR